MSPTRAFLALLILLSATPVVTGAQGVRRSNFGKRLFGQVHRMLPRSLDSAVALCDVDGDGDLDAVLGGRLQLNDGTGLLVEAPDNLPIQARSGTLALGDVDGDGDPDLLTGSRLGAGLFLNDGSGVFSDASSNLPSSTDKASMVALGDLDGDGDLDAYVGSWSGRGGIDRIYLNDGTGVFSYAQFNLPFNVGGSFAFALGDVDGDGDLDVLAAHQDRFMHEVFGAQNRLYVNGGTGFFSEATFQLPATFDRTFQVAFGDVDGDDDLDALIGNGGSVGNYQRSSLWLNNGNGRFTSAPQQLPPDGDLTRALAFGDVDGDGDLDLLLGNDGQSRLYVNGGTGTFADLPGSLPMEEENVSCAALGDLDGDGDLDAVLAATRVQSRLLLNDGNGAFVDATNAPRSVSYRESTNDLAAGDVDGDGDPDVLSATRNGTRLHRNDGLGVFEEDAFPSPAEETSAVGVADVDGDGDLDALTGSERGGERLYLNDGLGAFSDHSAQLPGIANEGLTVAFGDLDGDGDADAIVGSLLYVNDGAGTFQDGSGQLPSGLAPAVDATLGDVNGDGSLDVVLGGEDVRLLLGDGNGAFVDATGDLPVVAEGRVNAVALGDVEQDGDLDLFLGLNRFFGGGNGDIGGGAVMGPVGRDHLFLNEGAGLFAEASAFLPDKNEVVTAVTLADLDGDGDLDAVLGAAGRAFSSGPNRVYLNDGSGRFLDRTFRHLELESEVTRAALLVDFDSDGDLDLWFGNDREDRLYTNLSRQVAWRTLPRAGQPLVLDLFGPVLGKWMLATALGAGSTPLHPHGNFQLDPATFQLVGSGNLGASGRATATVPLPPELSLEGLTLYWQAWFHELRRFSNLEATTLSGL